MPKPSRFPVVYVEWEDIASWGSGWEPLAEVYQHAENPELFTMHAAGFLTFKTKRYICLQTILDPRQGMAGTTFRIPTGCITKLKRLQ